MRRTIQQSIEQIVDTKDIKTGADGITRFKIAAWPDTRIVAITATNHGVGFRIHTVAPVPAIPEIVVREFIHFHAVPMGYIKPFEIKGMARIVYRIEDVLEDHNVYYTTEHE